MSRIAIIDAHPDPSPERFCRALVTSYAEGAKAGGHELRILKLSELEVPLLRSAEDWEHGSIPASLADAQAALGWADHLVFVFPLWLGSMPALLKGFLEQALRPGFAIRPGARSLRVGLLGGKSARIVITMGMPAPLYRWYFGAHSLKSFERNILRFVGIGRIAETLIGGVGNPERNRRWLDRMREFGKAAR